MNDQPSIEPSLSRIDRADEHIRNLDAECRAFIQSNPYEVISEYDPHTLTRTTTVLGLAETPVRLRLMAGEIAHHLRASYDLLVYQLMLRAHVTDEKRLAQCGFPAVMKCDLTTPSGRKKYESFMSGKIKGIWPEAGALIEQLQPHRTGYSPEQSFLAQITHLDNTDKHRLVLAVVCGIDISNMRWHDGDRPPLEVAPQTYIPLHADTVFKMGPLRPEVQMDSKLPMRIEVTFGEKGTLWLKPVVPTLQNLSDVTRKTIRSFRRFFA
jgi:hypothetical protein